jgi:hypothetical protein
VKPRTPEIVASKLGLNLAGGNSDRTRAVRDGGVGIEGTEVDYVDRRAEQASHRVFEFVEFHVTEISFSSRMTTAARAAREPMSPLPPSSGVCFATR